MSSFDDEFIICVNICWIFNYQDLSRTWIRKLFKINMFLEIKFQVTKISYDTIRKNQFFPKQLLDMSCQWKNKIISKFMSTTLCLSWSVYDQVFRLVPRASKNEAIGLFNDRILFSNLIDDFSITYKIELKDTFQYLIPEIIRVFLINFSKNNLKDILFCSIINWLALLNPLLVSLNLEKNSLQN
ncbi:hypothetical protein BpHYR1_053910 [Brachionus plicatilis]|uniref:Uncharacterized protein n=1 Tax=Brachionus plicatilis TaxID=10195 RepID=A0A3M7QBI5_BRAPC|nr:hypothetical protein BpHYR1_053910 [Brachionus plicatilis]